MPPEVFSPKEIRAVAAKNPLRQYPGLRKGKERLLPFAQPQIRTDLRFSEGAKFFVAGNCYGRNLEKALAKAGRTYLSSPSDLDLPGTAKQQYNRYNIFNLDVSTNEIIWAIDPKAQPADDALIQVGHEWVDMQIHWTFAHEEAQAKEFRSIYNTSYAGVADADVVILSSSGIEQWFDRETGLYLNGMPTAKMDELYPGRFEFHRLDTEACTDSLRRAIEVVRQNTRVTPIILVTVSPVQQPLVYGRNDALIEQFLAKSYLRAAAEQVCHDYPEVEYLPSLEFAMLSDFQYAYSAQSLNHSSQGLANRVVAEMLLRYDGETPGYHALRAIGLVEALLSAGEYDQAMALAEASIEAGAPMSYNLDFQYSQALVRSGQHQQAATWLMKRLDSAVDDEREPLFRLATNLVRAYGSRDDIERLLGHAEALGIEDETVGAIKLAVAQPAAIASTANQGSSPVDEIAAAFKAQDYDAVAARSDALFEDVESTPELLQRTLPFVVRSLMSLGQHKLAISRLYAVVSRQDEPDARWTSLMVKLATSHGDVPMIEQIIAISDKIKDSEDLLEPLERRRATLARRAVNEPS